MEITISFDIGAYSTKVSFFGLGSASPLTTLELPNMLLFKKNGKQLIGDKALKKLEEDVDEYANSYVTNFISLLGMDKESYLNSRETFFAVSGVKSTSRGDLLFHISNTNKFLTAYECLTIFLTKIRKQLIKRYFNIQDVKFVCRVVIEENVSLEHREAFTLAFYEAGYARTEFCYKGLAVGYLYAKQNNYLANKDVLFIDIGYAKCSFTLVHIDKEQISIKADMAIDLGLRDLDYEIYMQIIADLKTNYGIDYVKDKKVKLSLLNKINRVKKGFSVNAETKLHLANTFGSRYIDQYITITEDNYENRNNHNFDYFTEELSNFVNEVKSREDISIEDVQIIGGGRKIAEFTRIVSNHVELEAGFDKLNSAYASSKGCLLNKEFDGKVSYINNTVIYFELIEGIVDDKFDGNDASREDNGESCNGVKDDVNQEENVSDYSEGSIPLTLKDSEYNTVCKERHDMTRTQFGFVQLAEHKNKIVRSDVLYTEGECLILGQSLKTIVFESDPKSTYSLHIYYKVSSPEQKRLSICSIPITRPFNKLHIGLDETLRLSSLRLEPEGIELETYSDFNKACSKFHLHFNHSNHYIKPEPQAIVISTDNRSHKHDHIHSCHNPCESSDEHRHHHHHSKHEPQAIVISSDNRSHKHDRIHSCHQSCESSEKHHRHHHKYLTNPLIDATFLHEIADLVQAICLLVIAILIFFKPSLEILDPIVSLLISIIIIFLAGKYTISLFVKLMEATPVELNYRKILNKLTSVSGVLEVHDLHLWELGDKKYAGTAHILTNIDQSKVLKEATLIFRKYKIYHTTIQIETPTGRGDSMYISCDNNID